MLSAEAYERLYRASKDVSHGNMVEIGAAHGASTIALALGMKEGGNHNTIYTFEKGEGGSRSEFGTKEENIHILKENLKSYDVEDIVSLIPEYLTLETDIPKDVEKGAPFSLLSIDADGILYRDFELFYDYLLPGATIIIDDYEMRRGYREKTDRYPLGGGKSYRTFCFVNYLIDSGYLTKSDVVGDTLVGMKPLNGPEFELDEMRINEIHRHLKEDRERARH